MTYHTLNAVTRFGIALTVALWSVSLICAAPGWSAGQAREVYFYEVDWNGTKAAHGDITTERKNGVVKVSATAVTDNPLKRILDIWSRIQAKFHLRSHLPVWYQYRIRSNLLRSEVVDLKFDHKAGEVTVSKFRGDSEEKHREKINSAYDPVSAAFLLRKLMPKKKPLAIDVYDGKDRARLIATPMGASALRVRGGAFRSAQWSFRVLKLTGDRREVAKGRLWVSDDADSIPLLLTSRPVVGTVRFELVRVQRQTYKAAAQ